MIAFLFAAVLTFHPIQIIQMARETCGHWEKVHTHVEVDGWVTYKAREDDGDWHLRICDDQAIHTMNRLRCIVAEIIPALPLKPPKVGDHVRVRGIYRFDAEEPNHGWAEVHPVLQIEVLP